MLEKLEEHINYLYEENLDQSQVLQKPKCYECDRSFKNNDKLIKHKKHDTLKEKN